MADPRHTATQKTEEIEITPEMVKAGSDHLNQGVTDRWLVDASDQDIALLVRAVLEAGGFRVHLNDADIQSEDPYSNKEWTISIPNDRRALDDINGDEPRETIAQGGADDGDR